VVLVSHLPTHRRSAVESLGAVIDPSRPTFYGGNAFMFESSRTHVPGIYLGETMAGASQEIRNALGM
jgi:hypothetical protein